MIDLISRQAATNALRTMQTYKLFAGDDMLLIDQAGAITEVMLLQSAQPAADVRENVKGEWIKHNIYHGSIPWGHDCSVCGHWFVVGEEKIKDYKFCPNCGAEMKGDNDV